MIYAGANQNDQGDGYAAVLKLTAEEKRLLESGKPVVRRSGDSRGHFKITVKLTRPRRKADRLRGL